LLTAEAVLHNIYSKELHSNNAGERFSPQVVVPVTLLNFDVQPENPGQQI